jgi:hypothetical protein
MTPTTPGLNRTVPYKRLRSGDGAVNRAIPFQFNFGAYHPDALAAFELHRQRAESMGQVWSDGHAHAFRELHNAYVLTAAGIHLGRTAWPLAVGTGKTQSLVAFACVQARHVLAGREPRSLLICIERVDQGRDLYNEMVNAGVPAELIGVYHRKTAREVAEEGLVPSVSEADACELPFLIATHAMMLKGDEFIAKVNTYREHERALVVWDESLIKSQGQHFDLARVEGAAAVLRSAVLDTQSAAFKDARDAATYIESCTARLREEFTKGLAGTDPVTVELPRLSPEDETRYHAAIGDALKGADMLWTGGRKGLVEFLEHVQRPVRVIPYMERGRRVGVVHYLTRIPESLTRLIVLDASHNIRRLTSEHDSTLRVTPINCKVKSFRDVAVRQVVRGAGRETLDKELPRKDSSFTKRLDAVFTAIPSDEGVVVVTFKANQKRDARLGKTHADHVKRHLARLGIDHTAKLADGRDRFVFLTWGQHIGVSEYAYCKHVVCVGVLRRDTLDVASCIVGQRNDLSAPHAADPAEVHEVVRSEMFHNIIQAAGRGACRTTVNGAASPMLLTLFCVETFPAEWWQEAMPGVTVDEAHAGATERAAKQSAELKALQDALAGLPDVDRKVSTRTLRVIAGLQSMQADRFARLLTQVKAEGWKREGRSFVRCEFTFTAEAA